MTDTTIQADTPALLPCPHCGMAVTLKPSHNAPDTLFVFACPDDSPCHGSGYASYALEADLPKAIAAWNRRAALPHLSALDTDGVRSGALEEAAKIAETSAYRLDGVRHGSANTARDIRALKANPSPQAGTGEHSDDKAVDRFAAAMKNKLARKRNEGRGGWQSKEECSAKYLSDLLHGHIVKGDPVDVANLAMMLHQRGETILPVPSTTSPDADVVTEAALIDHMVGRFLRWRLPENFSPDAGISFKAAYNEGTDFPAKHEPIGTNLFDNTQATAMVRYMLEGMPLAALREPVSP